MVFLTSVDRKELNSAVAEYLKSQNLPPSVISSIENHLSDANNNNNTSNDSSSTSSTLLEKRWSTFKRLTLANTQLEDKVKKLEAEVSASKNPFSNNSGAVATTSSSSSQLLLLLPSGPSPLHQFKGHRDSITSIAIHPLDPLIISSSLDGTVRVWNTQTKKQIQKITTSGASVNCISIEPTTGEMFAIAVGNDEGGCGVYVYEMKSNLEENEQQEDVDITTNNNNHDDDLFGIGKSSSSNPFEYVCTKSLKHVTTSSSSRSNNSSDVEDISCVTWSSDSILITCTNSGSVNVWEIPSSSLSHGNNKKLSSSLLLEGNVNFNTNNNNNDSSSASSSLLVRKISSCSATLMTKNKFVALGCSDQSLFMLNIPSSKQHGNISSDGNVFCAQNSAISTTNPIHSNAVTCLSFINHPTGENLLVEKYSTSAERRAERREWLRKTSSSSSSSHLSLDDNPQYLISSSRDKNIVLSELKYSSSAIKSFSSSPSAKNMMMTGENSILIVPVWKFEGHGGWVNSFTLLLSSSSSSSSLFITSTSDDDTMRVIDLISKKEVRRVTDNCNGSYGCVAVAPLCSSSKMMLCSGGSDKLVSVWGFKE